MHSTRNHGITKRKTYFLFNFFNFFDIINSTIVDRVKSSNILFLPSCFNYIHAMNMKNDSMSKKKFRGHTELNHGPLDLQSNALPLSYTPSHIGQNRPRNLLL